MRGRARGPTAARPPRSDKSRSARCQVRVAVEIGCSSTLRDTTDLARGPSKLPSQRPAVLQKTRLGQKMAPTTCRPRAAAPRGGGRGGLPCWAVAVVEAAGRVCGGCTAGCPNGAAARARRGPPGDLVAGSGDGAAVGGGGGSSGSSGVALQVPAPSGTRRSRGRRSQGRVGGPGPKQRARGGLPRTQGGIIVSFCCK